MVLKALLESRCTSSPALLSFTKLVILLHKGMIGPDFCFINSCWLFPITSLSLMHLVVAAKIFRSNPFSRTKVRQTSLHFLGFLFLSPFRYRSNICFLPVLTNLSRQLWPFKDNQQCPCGDCPAPSVLMGKTLQGCTHTSVCPILPYVFECSLIWSFFLKGNSSFLQTFPTSFRNLELLNASLTSKD